MVARPVPGNTAATLASINSLCDAVDDLLARLGAAEQGLSNAQGAISAEVTARGQAVSGEATARGQAVGQERVDRTTAVTALSDQLSQQISSLRDGLSQQIDAETAARTTADSNERQSRSYADDVQTKALADATAQQAQALSNAVAKLQAGIDGKADGADLKSGLADVLAQAKAVTDAISATIAAQRLEFVIPDGRPGDAPLRYTFVPVASALAGARAGLPLLPPGLLAYGDSGPVVRVSGPGILAKRAPLAVEVGRLYRVRYVVQRRANPADPTGDTVRCGLVFLDQSLRVIGDVVPVRDYPALVTANGRQPYEVVLSRTPSPDGPIGVPTAARFLVPVVQFFGPDHLTDVEVMAVEDATTAFVLPAISADLAAQIAALIADDLNARLEVVEQALGTPGAVTFRSKGDARYGTIPDSVQVVTLLGRQYAGDGGHGLYVRTAATVAANADTFISHGATFLRVAPAADIAAGVLTAAVAALPREAPDTSGRPWLSSDLFAVTP